MAKVFMSMLGTGGYLEAHYRLNERVSSLTPFVQEAYLELTRDQWSREDRLVFFLTEKARATNWEDGSNFSEGLATRLKNRGFSNILDVSFKEGSSEEEIMDNFTTIFEQLKEGDQVVFDITHSFRSLPMLALVALTYAKVLKNIEIKGLYYGAFEVLGSRKEAEKIPEDERIAPIFDLTPFVSLLDWSFAVEEFVRYGLANRLEELIDKDIRPILKETKGKDKTASALRGFKNSISLLATSIYTSRCRSIVDNNWGNLAISEELCKGLLPPFDPLFEKIEGKIWGFLCDDSWAKAKAAVEWCIEHGLVQQGYTILTEALVGEMCIWAGFDDVYDRSNREFSSELLVMTARGVPGEKWKGALKNRKSLGIELQKKGGEKFIELAKIYESISKARNDINHCGCRENASDETSLAEGLQKNFEKAALAVNDLRRSGVFTGE